MPRHGFVSPDARAWRAPSLGIVGGSQAVEEREDLVGGLMVARPGSRRRGAGEGLLPDGHVGVDIGIGGADASVAEPERDDRGVNSGLQQRHSATVA